MTPTPAQSDAPAATPRTEEELEGWGHTVMRFMPVAGEPASDKYVRADFARTLERELSAASAELERVKGERDEAKLCENIADTAISKFEAKAELLSKCLVVAQNLNAGMQHQLEQAELRATTAEAALEKARENEERYLFLKSRLTVPGAVHQFLRLNDWPPETDLSDIDAAIDAARTK
jgi:hypothetical protein